MQSPPRNTPQPTAPLVGVRRAQQRRANHAALLIVTFAILGLAAVFARTAQLQLATPTRLAEQIDDRLSRISLEAPRGDIRDRRGRLIASTKPGYRLFLDPHALITTRDGQTLPQSEVTRRVYDTIRSVAQQLGPSSRERPDPGPDPDRIAQRIAAAAQRALDRSPDEPPLRYARLTAPLHAVSLARLRALAESTPHLHLERVPVRETNPPPGAESLVGIVGFSHSGLLGAEATFDQRLTPRAGHIASVRDARGGALWVNADDYAMPARGEDVRLSIDTQLQRLAVEELELGVQNANAAGGRVVLIDPQTGEIIALADLVRRDLVATPFDPDLADAARRDDLPIRFRVIEPDPNLDPDNHNAIPALARNRCVEHVYEPGSTFKPFVWAATLAHRVATPDEIFNTEQGRWRTPDRRIIEDVSPQQRQSFREVLIRSSNIGMIKAAHRLTDAELQHAIRTFGFGERTRVGLPGEAPGLVTPPARWRESTQTSVAMGYEVAATPLQMARAFAVFARTGPFAGTLPSLTLLANHDAQKTPATLTDPQPPLLRRVIDPAIAAEVRDTLAQVADRMLQQAHILVRDDPEHPWAGFPFADYPRTIFGKSGTSKIARPDGRGYFPWQYHASFVAASPAESPRLLALVVIDDPDPSLARERRAFGSQVAGPVAARLLHRALDYLGQPPDRPEAAPIADANPRPR